MYCYGCKYFEPPYGDDGEYYGYIGYCNATGDAIEGFQDEDICEYEKEKEYEGDVNQGIDFIQDCIS